MNNGGALDLVVTVNIGLYNIWFDIGIMDYIHHMISS